MPAYEFVTVDVFTDRRFGGNPLAVFPDARGLSDAEMQSLAREFQLSETAFVLPSAQGSRRARVRIFTPSAELPFAGHPNVGTGFVLACRDPADPEPFRFDEGAGPVTVRVLRDPQGGPVGAEVDAPHSLSIGIAVAAETVAACAGLDEDAVRLEQHAPLVAGVGLDFVVAELRSREVLREARPDPAGFRRLLAAHPELPPRIGLHLYVRDPDEPARLHARMFSPMDGIPEDPATGSANAALAALLVSMAPGEDVTLGFEILQGAEMGRPSRIAASASKSAEGAVSASVGGGCVPVLRGFVDL